MYSVFSSLGANSIITQRGERNNRVSGITDGVITLFLREILTHQMRARARLNLY